MARMELKHGRSCGVASQGDGRHSLVGRLAGVGCLLLIFLWLPGCERGSPRTTGANAAGPHEDEGGVETTTSVAVVPALLSASEATQPGEGTNATALRVDPSVRVREGQGVTWVHTEGDGVWTDEERWSLRASWVRGELSDSVVFGRLTVVESGKSGRVYAIDFQAQSVHVFASDGTTLGVVGGPGQGPGEFEGPLALAEGDDGSLWVVDGWNQRYTLFSAAGEYIRTEPRSLRIRGFQQRLMVEDEGSLLDETVLGSGTGVYPVLVRVHLEGGGVDTLAAFPSPWDVPTVHELRPGGPSTAAYRPSILFAATRRGTVWSGRSDRMELIERTLEGDTLRVISTDRSPPRASRDELAAIAEGQAGTPVPLGRQVMQSIHPLDDGHLLVQIEEEAGVDGTLFGVFNPDGVLLGTLVSPVAPRARTVASTRGDTIWTVASGSLDEDLLVRMVISRPGR